MRSRRVRGACRMPQCKANTKDGTGPRCKRPAEDGFNCCWQHKGDRIAGSCRHSSATSRQQAHSQSRAQGGQCRGITRQGSRCIRLASDGTDMCGQHAALERRASAEGRKATAGVAQSRSPSLQRVTVAETQCAGTTSTNERCSRTAVAGTRFCWQHESRAAESSQSTSTRRSDARRKIPDSVSDTGAADSDDASSERSRLPGYLYMLQSASPLIALPSLPPFSVCEHVSAADCL